MWLLLLGMKVEFRVVKENEKGESERGEGVPEIRGIGKSWIKKIHINDLKFTSSFFKF